MIKNWRYRVTTNPNGKITSGKKSDRGLPQSLDYFNIEKFPELLTAYGKKPTNLILCVPSNNIPDFFDCNFEQWGKGETSVKHKSCDGETCTLRTGDKAGQEVPCVCKNLDEDDKTRCKYRATLKAYIMMPQTGQIETPLCYVFETHSQNSGDAIYSELEKVKVLNGGNLAGVPFSLSVKMVSGKTQAKQKFPIWTLTVIGTVKQIQEKSFMLSEPSNLVLPINEETMKDSLIRRAQDAPDRKALNDIYQELIANKTKILIFDYTEIENAIKEAAKKFPKG